MIYVKKVAKYKHEDIIFLFSNAISSLFLIYYQVLGACPFNNSVIPSKSVERAASPIFSCVKSQNDMIFGSKREPRAKYKISFLLSGAQIYLAIIWAWGSHCFQFNKEERNLFIISKPIFLLFFISPSSTMEHCYSTWKRIITHFVHPPLRCM